MIRHRRPWYACTFIVINEHASGTRHSAIFSPMSALPPPSLPAHWTPSTAQTRSANEPGRLIFTRQLWQRTMQGGNQTDQRVSNKSQAQDIPSRTSAVAGSSRRSSVSTRSQKHSPNSSQAESQTPLTPEESPPFSRKRTAAVVEEEDKEIDNTDATPANQRQSSVCICPPDPKIPRPRNGGYTMFILSIP